MAMSIRFQVLDNTGPLSQQTEYLARHTTQACAEYVRDHIRREMAKPKSGKRYRIRGTDVWYTASRPGEYPAIRTSVLAQHIEIYTPESTRVMRGAAAPWPRGDSIVAFLGTDVPYAKYLEGEDPPGSGLRPFLNRAAHEVAPDLQPLAESLFRPGSWSL
jgi:hypothetical protein